MTYDTELTLTDPAARAQAPDGVVHLSDPDTERTFLDFLGDVVTEAEQVNALSFEDQALTERPAHGTRSGARVAYVDGRRHSVHHIRLKNGRRARLLLAEDEWNVRDVRGLTTPGAFDGATLASDDYSTTAGRDMATVPPRDRPVTRDRFESAGDPWAEIEESFKAPGPALGVWS